MTVDLWLSLLCAVLFAAAALVVKRGNALGIGAWHATLTSNLATVFGFVALWPLGGNLLGWLPLWQPAVVAILFIAGQWLAFAAFDRGEVSIATPVLGVKIVLVALGVAMLIGQSVGWRLWTAAGLSTVAVALLNFTDHARTGRAGRTVLLAGGAAVCFALFDVLVQKWSPAWGVGRFLPIMMFFVAGLSLAVHPWMPSPRQPSRPGAWRWVLAGSALMALQSTLFVTMIAVYQNAAPANVVFSSRGLWSVLLVWLIGHWFHSPEQSHGRAVLGWRLAGATLMSAAIAMVVWR
jgi:drug/metabolite transporter (DMT)-like permease